VDIVLGSRAREICTSFDQNRDRQITIAELVGAVQAALDGCRLAGA
jgi:hypothetical protein